MRYEGINDLCNRTLNLIRKHQVVAHVSEEYVRDNTQVLTNIVAETVPNV
jgi:hypothetical protein